MCLCVFPVFVSAYLCSVFPRGGVCLVFLLLCDVMMEVVFGLNYLSLLLNVCLSVCVPQFSRLIFISLCCADVRRLMAYGLELYCAMCAHAAPER